MVHRFACLAGVVVLASVASLGCRTQLDRVWTFGEFRDHAEKIDSEFDQFHKDLKDNLFGIEQPPSEPVWMTYGE
jgi:hypothetical protein